MPQRLDLETGVAQQLPQGSLGVPAQVPGSTVITTKEQSVGGNKEEEAAAGREPVCKQAQRRGIILDVFEHVEANRGVKSRFNGVEAPFDDLHMLDSREPLAEDFGERWLRLDRDHLRAFGRGKRSEGANSGADIDHAPAEFRPCPPEEPLVVGASTGDVFERAVECLYYFGRLTFSHGGGERTRAASSNRRAVA